MSEVIALMQQTTDTGVNWSSVNPVLHVGQWGVEFDPASPNVKPKVKMGVGLNWLQTPYFTSETELIATPFSKNGSDLTNGRSFVLPNVGGFQLINVNDAPQQVTRDYTVSGNTITIVGDALTSDDTIWGWIFQKSPVFTNPSSGSGIGGSSTVMYEYSFVSGTTLTLDSFHIAAQQSHLAHQPHADGDTYQVFVHGMLQLSSAWTRTGDTFTFPEVVGTYVVIHKAAKVVSSNPDTPDTSSTTYAASTDYFAQDDYTAE